MNDSRQTMNDKGADSMYARTWGETTRGINGEMVTVEVDVTNGMPAFEWWAFRIRR